MSEKWEAPAGYAGHIFVDEDTKESPSRHVCKADNPAIAQRVVTAVNNHDELVKVLKSITGGICDNAQEDEPTYSCGYCKYCTTRTLLANIAKDEPSRPSDTGMTVQIPISPEAQANLDKFIAGAEAMGYGDASKEEK